MEPDFDVIVAGGSIAGLAFAAEATNLGLSVLVAEEHESIGEPEKCDGLVSLRGLRRYGYLPDSETVQSRVGTGVVHSPDGGELSVNASSLEIVVLDRSEFDRQVQTKAESSGAKIARGARATEFMETTESVKVDIGGRSHTARYFVDATGPASSPKGGIIPAAKYEVEGEWVREGMVEVFLDVEKYPGFFAWIIPFGPDKAKVGAAGRGINSFKALDEFLSTRPHKLLRKVAAPIYVGGPVQAFVSGRKILVGESAGMVKPTTAGGIVTSIAGSALAARCLSDSIGANDPSLLANYQKEWQSRFGKEMRSMARLRGVFEKLSNGELDAMISTLSTKRIAAKLSETDFDFHATGLLGAIGVKGLLRMAKLVISAETRALLLKR